MIMMVAPLVQAARSLPVVQNHKVMLHLKLQIRHNCGFAFRARVAWPILQDLRKQGCRNGQLL
jgi:hypothetical protein